MHGLPISPYLPATTTSMAYKRLAWLLSTIAMVAVVFHPAPASAENYLVGDKAGWTLNYAVGWPKGKTFKVNDSLVFRYPRGEYTVTEVFRETGFRECKLAYIIDEWATGNDTVRLDRPGRRWFFSRVEDHCDLGLKLFVDVGGGGVAPAQPPSAPAPAPVTPPPPGSPGPAPLPNTTDPPVSDEKPPPSTPPLDKSAAALNHYSEVGEAVARAAVVAGAVVVAVLM